MFKKNDVLEIEITDQGTTGRGYRQSFRLYPLCEDTVIGGCGKGQGYEGEEKLCLCKTC